MSTSSTANWGENGISLEVEPAVEARYLALDALRGVAAFMVVLYHLKPDGFVRVHSGYLAVDFFFLLSGFVISRSYRVKLVNGLGFINFSVRRAIRLFPLLAVGILFGVIRHSLQIAIPYIGNESSLTPTTLAIRALFNLFLLPSPVSRLLTPINGPVWSLICELAVNLFYAGLIVRAKRSWCIAIVFAACVALIVRVYDNGTMDGGNSWKDLDLGLFRVMFSFALGALISTMRLSRAVTPRWHSIGLAFALICLLLFGVRGWYAYDLAFVVFVGPALLILGASNEPPPSLARVSSMLGDLSYPIYVIHSPILLTFYHFSEIYRVPRIVWVPTFLVRAIA